MTFSIVARDPVTGDLGVAVASKFLAVGSVVPWARAEVGAIATQALANVSYGPEGLEALAQGVDAVEVVARLTAADDGRTERQLGVVDHEGRAATHTGTGCLSWAGGRTGEGVAIQGNILAGPDVIAAIHAAWDKGQEAPFPDRLLTALLAGDRMGGDARGRQSAALLVVRREAGYGGGENDRWIDLRVDDHPDPVPELQRLLGEWRLLYERPVPEALLEIDEALATELRERLTKAGWDPGRDDGLATAIRGTQSALTRIGEPAEAPPTWDEAWDGALLTWMGVANLEERSAAFGRIDPVVLEELRAATDRATVSR